MVDRQQSPRDTNFIEQITNADGYDDYTESSLARLAARYESSTRIQQITRTSTPQKEPKGWRDEFKQIISRRRQTPERERRSHNKEKKRRSHAKVAHEELIPVNKIRIACPRSESSCSRLRGFKEAPSINPVPTLKSLSTIKEHVNDASRRWYDVSKANRISGPANDNHKQKKLRTGGSNSHKQQTGSIFSSTKLKRERMMTFPVFQLDPAVPSLSHFLAAQNEVNPTCRPSILEGLVLKGELLPSSLLGPDPAVENLGFQDLSNSDANKHEIAAGRPKGTMININFAVTTAFNVPTTGLLFPPLERRVRVCLFDGCSFLGNVYVFPAVTAIDEEDQPWVFVNKGASRCLVQYSSTKELRLYVEINVRYKSTGEYEHREATEITCAWAMMDLPRNEMDAEELLLSSSSSELRLMVGSMERPVDANKVHIPSGRSRVVVKKGGNISAIRLHWYKLSDFQKKYSRLLPETILASNEDFPFLVLYRKTLLDTLLNESSLLSADGAVFSPLIQLYPWMLNERGKQLQEVFKESWIARKLEWPPNTDCMKRKNRDKYLKGFNNSLLMIWPLLRSHNVRQPTQPFHATLETTKFEDPCDIIGKHVDGEIGKSSTLSDSSGDGCSSSGSEDSETTGTETE